MTAARALRLESLRVPIGLFLVLPSDLVYVRAGSSMMSYRVVLQDLFAPATWLASLLADAVLTRLMKRVSPSRVRLNEARFGAFWIAKSQRLGGDR